MQSCAYIPNPPLSNFVDYFWYVEGWDLPHTRERLFPTGRMELVIDLSRNHALQPPIVSGIYSKSSEINIIPFSSLIGVQFKPGGSLPFFPSAADALHNRRVALTDLWGTTAMQLQEQLVTTPSVTACFQLLEQMLRAQIITQVKLHPAVLYALNRFQQMFNGDSVADVVAETGLSSRRFIQIFRQQVGLTPKLFCRIQRFQQSLHALATRKDVEWVRLANACGYFDQAHFINEFRTFSGLNPTAYLSNRGENPNHLALL